MAEALAVVGIVANIIQLVDFGSRVMKRLEEYQSELEDIPEGFRHIKTELPVLLNALRATKAAIDAGLIQDESKKALLPTVEGCVVQIKALDDVITKALPASGDSWARRGRKALRNLRYDAKVEKITAVVRGYIQTLTYYAAASSRPLADRTLPRPPPSSTVPFRRDPHFVDRGKQTETDPAVKQLGPWFPISERIGGVQLDEGPLLNKVIDQDPEPRISLEDQHKSRVSANVRFGDLPGRDLEADAEKDKEPYYGPSNDLVGDQESDTDSLSDNDSLYSWGKTSNASTAPTETEVAVTNIEDIAMTFMALVFEEKGVFEAMWVVLSNHSMQALESQTRTLLKQFVGALHDESRLCDHDMSTIFRGRSHFISRKIAHGVEIEGQTRGWAQDGSDDGEQYLDDGGDEEMNVNEDQGADDSDREDNEVPEVGDIDVSEFRRLISSSPAFRLFLDEIYNLAFPSFKKRLERLLEHWKRKRKHPDSTTQVETVVGELAYSRPNVITIIQPPPGWVNQLKGFIEEFTGEPWDWWPLAPRLKPLQKGQVWIMWNCKCSRTRTEVVPREFAVRLKKLVNKASITSQAPGRDAQPAVPDPAHLSPEAGPSIIPQMPTSHSPRLDSTQMGPDSSLRPRRVFHAIEAGPLHAIFFLVYNGTIFPWSRGLKRSKIRSRSLCDNLFYSQMREEYWKHRGWWRKWLGLYTFEGCDFYLFKRYRVGRFRECKPDLPDQQRDGYQYKVEKLQPQVSWEEFRDGYWYGKSDCASTCGGRDGLERIPQKKLTTNFDEGPGEFWGIVAREHKSFLMVLIYTTLATTPIIPSIWFFFKWLNPGELTDEYLLANHRDNLSNAFVPLGIAIALLMAVLTCVK